jgi:hypothetical protein
VHIYWSTIQRTWCQSAIHTLTKLCIHYMQCLYDALNCFQISGHGYSAVCMMFDIKV